MIELWLKLQFMLIKINFMIFIGIFPRKYVSTA